MNFSSRYAIGDPSTIGLICDNGMNELCKDSMPNENFPERIEADCEGNLMFASENDPSCLDLCQTNSVELRSTMLQRRGWTKFVK